MADITRKIALLDYPRLASFSAADFNEVVMLVAFLEDRWVRLLDMDKRAPLRKAGEDWHKAFASYLLEAGCPYLSDSHPYRKEQLVDYVRWLVGNAISLSYEESAAAINKRAAEAISTTTAAGAVSGSAPLLDASGGAAVTASPAVSVAPEVSALIADLARMLQVSADERDSLHTLQAVHRAIRQRLLPAIAAVDSAAAAGGAGTGAGAGSAARPKGGSLAGRTRKPVALPPTVGAAAAAGGAGAGAGAGAASGSSSGSSSAVAPPDVSAFPAGLSTGDALLDSATAVLRMLYVADLRELQDAVTDIIVTVQEFTANPKTDASLGAVGR